MSYSISFANRTLWTLDANLLSLALKELRQKNIDVLDLTISNPTQCDFSYPCNEILEPLSSQANMVYSPATQGLFSARETICEYYKNKGIDGVDPSRIFLTSSTSEGYSYLFRLLVNPGERVLFPSPSYPLFGFLADINDIQSEAYALEYDDVDGWHVNFACMGEEYADSKTRAVILVNPNNPTGSFIRRNELVKFNVIAKKYNMALICDEVFQDFALDDDGEHVSFVNNKEVLTFVLGGLSKTLGLPQMKLSWIILSGPDDVVNDAKQRLEVIADTYLSVNTPVQNAFGVWLSMADKIQSEIKIRVRENYNFIQQKMKRYDGCDVLEMEGGWYSVLRISHLENEEDFILRLLREYYVLVHPGYFFDFEKEGFLVVSLLASCNVFRKGVEGIVKMYRRCFEESFL